MIRLESFLSYFQTGQLTAQSMALVALLLVSFRVTRTHSSSEVEVPYI